VRRMDIEEFYDADPRRRPSAELELGSEWIGADGIQHELNYVETVHEILEGWQEHMREPNSAQWLGDRLRAAGVAVGPTADPISDS